VAIRQEGGIPVGFDGWVQQEEAYQIRNPKRTKNNVKNENKCEKRRIWEKEAVCDTFGVKTITGEREKREP